MLVHHVSEQISSRREQVVSAKAALTVFSIVDAIPLQIIVVGAEQQVRRELVAEADFDIVELDRKSVV